MDKPQKLSFALADSIDILCRSLKAKRSDFGTFLACPSASIAFQKKRDSYTLDQELYMNERKLIVPSRVLLPFLLIGCALVAVIIPPPGDSPKQTQAPQISAEAT